MENRDKLYIVFSNGPENKMWYNEVDTDSNWTYQEVGGCHATDVFESYNEQEAIDYIEEQEKASIEYAVFRKKRSLFLQKNETQ